jgi:hypothetical protein
MSSRNYSLFERAMRQRTPLSCIYNGYPRALCPIILGHSQGDEKALTYQFGGQSSCGRPIRGEWRCVSLSKVSNAKLCKGPWRVGSSHTRPQRCIETVDLDVNQSSPYRPKRRL